MTRIFTLLVCLLPLAGCVSIHERALLHQDQERAYMQCNRDASRKVAAQPGDPISLAVAAVGLCMRESVALRAALDSTYHAAQAARLMDMYEGRIIKANTSWIVQDRLRFAQR